MSDITSDYERIEKRTRIHGNIRNGVIYFFLCLWALIVLFPFYWMVLTSVKSYGSYNAEYIPKFFTLSPTWQPLGPMAAGQRQGQPAQGT
jgi:multiple sugar transport system permease protein